VNEDNPGSAFAYGRTEDLARMDERSVHGPTRNEDFTDHPVTGVEEQSVELFLRDVPQPRSHAREDIGRSAYVVTGSDSVGRRSPPELQRGRDPGGGGDSDSWHALQRSHVEGSEPTQRAAEELSETYRYEPGRTCRATAADQQDQQLRQREIAGTDLAQALPRLLVGIRSSVRGGTHI
jgi:hypothetical protein